MEDLNLYLDFIIDDENEENDINNKTCKQLVIYKNQLIEFKNADGSKLTNKQQEQQKKLVNLLMEEYDATETNANYENFEIHDKMRKKEINNFKKACIQKNKTLINNLDDIISKINVLEKQLKTNSAIKYKEDHKTYLMEKIKCECGMETIRSNKPRHKKSKAHQVWEKIQEELKAKKLKNKSKIIIKIEPKQYPKDQEGNGYFEFDEQGNQILLYDNEGNLMLPKDKNGFTINAKRKSIFDNPF